MSAALTVRSHSSNPCSPLSPERVSGLSRFIQQEKPVQSHKQPMSSPTLAKRRKRDSATNNTSVAQATHREEQEVQPILTTPPAVGRLSVISNNLVGVEAYCNLNLPDTGNGHISGQTRCTYFSEEDQCSRVLRFIRDCETYSAVSRSPWRWVILRPLN